jgi:hypothetical protein
MGKTRSRSISPTVPNWVKPTPDSAQFRRRPGAHRTRPGRRGRRLPITIGSSPWQNAALPADVNGDGRVNPFDVLLVVARSCRKVREPATSGRLRSSDRWSGIIYPDQNMVDVDGNGRVTPFDALIIVSAIQAAQLGNGEGEGEGGDDLFAPLSAPASNDLPTVTYSALAPAKFDISHVDRRSRLRA